MLLENLRLKRLPRERESVGEMGILLGVKHDFLENIGVFDLCELRLQAVAPEAHAEHGIQQGDNEQDTKGNFQYLFHLFHSALTALNLIGADCCVPAASV